MKNQNSFWLLPSESGSKKSIAQLETCQSKWKPNKDIFIPAQALKTCSGQQHKNSNQERREKARDPTEERDEDSLQDERGGRSQTQHSQPRRSRVAQATLVLRTVNLRSFLILHHLPHLRTECPGLSSVLSHGMLRKRLLSLPLRVHIKYSASTYLWEQQQGHGELWIKNEKQATP